MKRERASRPLTSTLIEKHVTHIHFLVNSISCSRPHHPLSSPDECRVSARERGARSQVNQERGSVSQAEAKSEAISWRQSERGSSERDQREGASSSGAEKQRKSSRKKRIRRCFGCRSEGRAKAEKEKMFIYFNARLAFSCSFSRGSGKRQQKEVHA